jgi:hypothetical protein
MIEEPVITTGLPSGSGMAGNIVAADSVAVPQARFFGQFPQIIFQAVENEFVVNPIQKVIELYGENNLENSKNCMTNRFFFGAFQIRWRKV